jgi:NADH-quinone oxidoreductase subunit N
LELAYTLAPEIIIVLTALAVLAIDLVSMREEPVQNRFWVGGAFSIVGCVAAIGWLMLFTSPHHSAQAGRAINAAIEGMFQSDGLTALVKSAILILTISTILVSLGSKFTIHVGEYLSLILMSTAGMMLLVSSTDLLMVFVALELTSISLYILTAFNRQNQDSMQAALKYFLIGGMSAAFTLFGLSLVYGVTGSTSFGGIAAAFESSANAANSTDPLLLIALVMIAIGFGFKIAAAPFHLWAPDTYQTAPLPSAALVASGSKIAGFFALSRLLMQALKFSPGCADWRHFANGWLPLLAVMAVASMALGNFAAIAQKNVRRLLAYSAIAHSGYTLLGLMANNSQGLGSVIFYITTYGLTVVGAFAVVGIVEENKGHALFGDFAGFAKSEPLMAFCLMIFILSLAGIPPLAGFFGKFYLFTALAQSSPGLGMIWLIIFAIAMSAVSLYYYLQVLKQVYVAAPAKEAPAFKISLSTRVLVSVLAVAVLGVGCVPDTILGPILAAIQGSGF